MSSEEAITLEEVLNSLKEIASKIDEGLEKGTFPEVTRSYIERVGRSIKETLNLIDLLGRENTVQSPVSASGRSAMYNLRRAFYTVLGRLVREEGVNRTRSVEEWKKAAQKLIEFINNLGIRESPTKIVLTYEIAQEGEIKYWKPISADVFCFELESIREVKFE